MSFLFHDVRCAGLFALLRSVGAWTGFRLLVEENEIGRWQLQTPQTTVLGKGIVFIWSSHRYSHINPSRMESVVLAVQNLIGSLRKK
jgi:hypothetical protein